ncbi:MAG: non-homologous end-joining DNA ligase [Veillonellales bacterium]
MDIIRPMLAKISKLPKDEDKYGFEVKWDGMRAIIYYQNQHIKILSRNQNDVTQQYPELNNIPKLNQTAIFDGEIVYFGDNGKPSFGGLQHRMHITDKGVGSAEKKYPVVYIVFDLLSLGERSLLNLSYVDRRERLEKLNFNSMSWQTPSYKIGSGRDLMQAVKKMGLEGIMAKRLDSLYIPGKRSGDWLKIKNKQRQEFVIGAWIPGNGNRYNEIGSLLLGYYNARHQLKYAGKVGTGFTTADLKNIKLLLQPLLMQQNPFENRIPYKDALFVQPNLVCEIEFTEWTLNHTLRHPAFKGLRSDKSPKEVIKEEV